MHYVDSNIMAYLTTYSHSTKRWYQKPLFFPLQTYMDIYKGPTYWGRRMQHVVDRTWAPEHALDSGWLNSARATNRKSTCLKTVGQRPALPTPYTIALKPWRQQETHRQQR